MMFLTGISNFAQDVFYDVSIYEQIFRIFLATLLGAVLGMERELKNKPAGFITFMLVSLGSCVIALLQINIVKMTVNATGDVNVDATRIIAQVVSGIGFLGAGTIINNRGNVKGISTAALLWVSAGVGLCVGIGGLNNYVIAVATVVVFFPFVLIARKVAMLYANKKKVHRILIVFDENLEDELNALITQRGGIIKKTFFHNKTIENQISNKEVFYYIAMQKKYNYSELIESIASLEYVIELEEV